MSNTPDNNPTHTGATLIQLFAMNFMHVILNRILSNPVLQV